MPPTPMIGSDVRRARKRTTSRARLVSGAPESPPGSAADGSASRPSRDRVVFVAISAFGPGVAADANNVVQVLTRSGLAPP